MPAYSLDRLKQDIQTRYAPLDVSLDETRTVHLRQILALPQELRYEVYDLMGEMNAVQDAKESGDPEQLKAQEELAKGTMRAIILKVASNQYMAGDLLKELAKLDEIDDDDQISELAALQQLIETYMETAQMGEASASPA